MDYSHHITVDPEIRSGKPCIVGTRITVGDILDCIAADMSIEKIIDDYPKLTKESILAAVAFAANNENRRQILIAH